MAYARAASKLTIDNPEADGLITKWGIGVDWSAAERRMQALDWTPDLAGAYGWLYGDDCEYIEKLNAIAPMGTATLTAMSLSGWTVNSGLWRESPSAGHLRVKWLQFYDGRASRLAGSDFGSITSTGDYTPNLLVRLWRMPQPEDDTDPPLVDIIWEGDGTSPQYRLRLPGAQAAGGMADGDTRTHHYPTLYGKPHSASQWAVVDEYRGGGMSSYSLGDQAVLQALKIEYTDGWFLCRFGGSESVWAFRGTWQDSLGRDIDFSMTDGPVSVDVCGHPCFVHIKQLAYAKSTSIRPPYGLYVPEYMETTPSYRTVKHEPAGCSVTVTAGDVTTDGRCKYPSVAFAGTGTERPVFYRAQEYRASTIGSAVSSEVTTEDNAELELLSISGRVDEDWRGASIDAVLEAQSGSDLADVAYNSKIVAAVSLDNGDNWQTQFTGYTLAPVYTADDPTARRVMHLQAADGVQARLRHKQMFWHCSYEGWPVGEAFEHILNRAGVPAALISVHADVSEAEMADQYYLPQSEPRGGELLAFRPEEDVISALDKIATIRDLEWGVDEEGVYFLRPRTRHVAGAYDHTLDEDTANDEDVIVSFESAQDYDEFCNMLFVLVGSGESAAAHLMTDFPSVNDNTADNYIGEDRWKAHVEPDGDDALALAKRLWQKREELAQTIYWTTHYHADWMPGDEVRVQIDRANVPTNTIFRITSKSWQVDADGQFEQTLEGVIVEEGE